MAERRQAGEAEQQVEARRQQPDVEDPPQRAERAGRRGRTARRSAARRTGAIASDRTRRAPRIRHGAAPTASGGAHARWATAEPNSPVGRTQQHERHRPEEQERRALGQQRPAERLDLADQQRADQRAADRAETADHHDDQREDQHVLVQARAARRRSGRRARRPPRPARSRRRTRRTGPCASRRRAPPPSAGRRRWRGSACPSRVRSTIRYSATASATPMPISASR